MLILPIKVDTSGADKATKEWVQKTSEQLSIKPKIQVEDTFKRLQDGAGKVNKALKTGTDLLGKYSSIMADAGIVSEEVAGNLANAATQTASWAATGASLGSVFPGIGTAIGGAVGGLASAVSLTVDWWRGTSDVAEKTKEAQENVAEIGPLYEDQNEELGEMDLLWLSIVDGVKTATTEVADFATQTLGTLTATQQIADLWSEINAFQGQQSAEDLVQAAQEAALFAEEVASDLALGLATQEDLTQAKERALELDRLADEALDRITPKAQTIAKDTKKTAESAGEWLDNLLKIDRIPKPKRELEEDRPGVTRGVEGAGDRGIARDSMGDRTEDPLGEFRREQAKKATSEIANELQEREDLYRGYFEQVSSFLGNFTAQLEENIAQGNGLFEGMGLAAQRGVAEVLKALGKKWGTEAISELAAGVAALATPGQRQDAPGHFASAALYGSAAAAAGIGGALIAGSATRQGNARADSAGASGVQSPRMTDPGTQQMSTVVYMGGGPGSTTIYAGESEREKQNARKKLSDILTVGKPK